MIASLLLLSTLTLLAPAPPSSPAAQDATGAQEPFDMISAYQGLVEDDDFDGLVALFRAHEDMALRTIDRDLEGSLALWESTQADDETEQPVDPEAQAAIDALHARALFGGRAASAAFDRPIFQDYAASFISWNTAQKRRFRAGQAAFGAAMEASGEGAFESARDSGQRCFELAMPLGDWWGAAMGLGASGTAKLALGDPEGALGDLSQARLLNQALGLGRAETKNLTQMLACLEKLEAWPRALVTLDALVARLGDEGQTLYADQRKRILDHMQ